MPDIGGWEARIGRRLRLRDLHVFSVVAQDRSMAKAAASLRVTQPAVSRAIGDLEAALRVRLFDRSPRGVELNLYGQALLNCGRAVFDELRQGIQHIEFLSDPRVGEVRIGSVESITAATLTPVIQRFYQDYPKVTLHVDDVPHRQQQLAGLQSRSYDLLFLRLQTSAQEDPVLGQAAEQFNVEILFEDRLVLAAGVRSPWARRRKIDIAELINEPWILPAPGTWNYERVAEAFGSRGLGLPKLNLVTTSVHLRSILPADGPFITAHASSALQTSANREGLKVLPVELPLRPWPVAIVTLKNRTLSPMTERLIECAREVAKQQDRPKPSNLG
jgi:DNA-binding transcriptional LysR family regulator